MDIGIVIDHLNKELGLNLSANYYSRIAEWVSWWQGYSKTFHRFKVAGVDGKITDRDLYSLRMAKKVCEDWASILLNEKTEIVLGDKQSQVYLTGDRNTGGVLGDNAFWQNGNALMEKAFATGTGAAILRFDNLKASSGKIVPNQATQIRLDYLPASSIVPLTIQAGVVTEAAFVSEVLEHGKSYVYVETHLKTTAGYRINNRYYEEKGGGLKAVELPEGILEELELATPYPLFSLVSPNIVNNIPGSDGVGLGISVYANAVDNLKGVDLAYNNFCRDFYLGGKKVFLGQEMVKKAADGTVLTPDDVAQQLFVQVGDSYAGQEAAIHEHNPDLRVADNKDGVQAQLDYLSFKCGLGTKHYQFNAGSIVTATQYMGDKQELVQNASKHYITVEGFLQRLCRAILWAGRYICGQPVNPETEIAVNFEDSYIIDKESERQRDLQEMRDGILQKWEYRAKWYGEDEATARAMVAKDSDSIMGFGDA